MSGIHRTPMGHWVVTADVVLRKWVEEFGTFEFPHNLETLRAVAPYIPEGGVVVEAGACIGDSTCSYARMVGRQGRVFAFEPHPQSFHALFLNVLHLTNVEARQCALGQWHNRQADFLEDANIGGSRIATLLESSAVQVEVCALDVLLRQAERFDFLHLDAEGFEPRILSGAQLLIERFHPAMLIEVTDGHLRRYGSSEVELLKQIASYGYHIERIPGSTQYDVLALPLTGVQNGTIDSRQERRAAQV